MASDPEAFLRLLSEANPWWSTLNVPERLAPPYRRSEFAAIHGDLGRRPVVALAGPRQVGKTTLMHQIVVDALQAGTDPKRILFVSFDLPGLGAVADDPLNEALGLYGDRILGLPWRETGGRVLVLLDEVAKAPGWHRSLKGWFDLGYDVGFVISDSSPTALREGAAESLTGRVTIHHLPPWKFVDVLAAGGHGLDDLPSRLRAALARSEEAKEPGPLHDAFRRASVALAPRRAPLRAAVDRYLLVDGFPELLGEGDLAWCSRRVREYIDLTLARDLYRHFGIRAPGTLEALLAMAAQDSGQRISYRGWARTLNVQERTLVEYLQYLGGAGLVSQAEFHSRSPASRLRKQRKVYVPNPAIRGAILSRLVASALQDPAWLGPSVEGVVHDHARRLADDPWRAPTYWRDRRGLEVDVVVTVRGVPLPIEVKYRTDPARDLNGLHAFLATHRSAPFGLVVSRDVLGVRGRILTLPLDLFLLLA